MFTSKSKTGNSTTVLTGANTTSLIGAGTTVTGDISCNGDIRIDGELKGNIVSKAKIVIGPAGNVEGDIEGTQADIMGTVKGSVRVKEMLQLKEDCVVNGNISAGKLQIEPTAVFNGQCNMHSESGQTDLKSQPALKKVMVSG